MVKKWNQDEPFQPLIKTDGYTPLVASHYFSTYVLNHQATVITLKNNVNGTSRRNGRTFCHFYKHAGDTDIMEGAAVLLASHYFFTNCL